jgi:hypothetical protein
MIRTLNFLAKNAFLLKSNIGHFQKFEEKIIFFKIAKFQDLIFEEEKLAKEFNLCPIVKISNQLKFMKFFMKFQPLSAKTMLI